MEHHEQMHWQHSDIIYMSVCHYYCYWETLIILVTKATKELAVRNRLSGHSLEPTQRPYFHNYSILWSCQQTPRLVLIKG